jgi:dihydroxyacetone kinase-like predicted kinase
MAAEQAVALSDKQVIVLPSKTIPQGIAAMLAFDPDKDADENRKTMTATLDNVRTGQVTYAARNSEFENKRIREGDFISICDGKMVYYGRKLGENLKRIARELVKRDSAFITIIYGKDISEQDALEAKAIFEKQNKGAEVNVINGGQPVYYYIISVE